MNLAAATSTTRVDAEAAVAAAARTGIGEFVVEERSDPCFAAMGGLSGEVRVVIEAVADVTDASALEPLLAAVASAWEECGYTVEQAEAADSPASLLFATAEDGRKASLRYAVPKGDRPWQIRLGTSSPCVRP